MKPVWYADDSGRWMVHTRVVGTTGTARRLTTTWATALGALALAACGAPARVAVVDATAAVGAAPAATTPSSAASRPVVTTEPPVPLTMNTVLPRSTVAPTATTAPRSSTATSTPRTSTTSRASTAPASGSPDGTDFRDSDGVYQLTIGPSWQDRSSLAQDGVEFWVVGPVDQGFLPNVSVQTRASGGRTLEEFVQTDATDVGGLHVESATIRTGSRGNRLAVVEVTGIPAASTLKVPLHMLMAVDIKGDVAVVAAFGATADTYDSLVADVEPYLLSLQAL